MGEWVLRQQLKRLDSRSYCDDHLSNIKPMLIKTIVNKLFVLYSDFKMVVSGYDPFCTVKGRVFGTKIASVTRWFNHTPFVGDSCDSNRTVAPLKAKLNGQESFH